MSSDSGKAFFEQFLDDYFAESEEHLTAARSHILALDRSETPRPVDEWVIDELLRGFHSLKGLSAMVGVDEVTQLAHHIEDYLRELKEPHALASPEGIERVLAGINMIDLVLAARRKSEPPPDIGPLLLQFEASSGETQSPPPPPSAAGAQQWRFEFKPSAELAAKGITVATVRDRIRNFGQILNASPRVLDDGGIAFDFVVSTEAPETAFEALASHGVEYAAISPDSTISAVYDRPGGHRPPLQPEPSPHLASLNVVRVEMSRLDDLMRLVGEMVISRFRLDETIQSRQNGERTQVWHTMQEINLTMERQIRDLRDAVMRVRTVPIGQVFERMRFVVRGLEREAGKRVEVEIHGQDTELDKMIVDTMMDPLLHIVRNAVSHGLESPEERVALGKPPIGIVRLAASTSGDTVLIEVHDDGRGMDLGEIASRAYALGLIRPGEPLDSKRLMEVISAPGFTTRDQADLASGRGVGMAAVQSAINELGGSITLETTPGRGTRFAMRLPLTLLIADALLVTVAQQRFAVPQSAVQEVLSIESSEVKVVENSEIVRFHGGVLPILRLRDFFSLNGKAADRMHVLVVENGQSPMGLAVDRITGQREIVVRAARDPLLQTPGVVGATELGDGRPVLILDPHSLIRAARDRHAVNTP